MALNHKRSAAVLAQREADRTERLAVRGLQADLQAVLDGINNTTTLAQLRGYVQDVARVCRRVLRLPNVAG